MSNLVLRAITGSVFVALMVASTQWPWLYKLLCLLLPSLCVWELMKMYRYKVWAAVATVILVSLAAATHIEYIQLPYHFIVVIALAILIVAHVKEKGIGHSVTAFIGILYILFSFYSYHKLIYISDGDHAFYEGRCFNNVYVLCMLIFIWTNDSFAYLVGRKIGKTPLAPSISPKKTIEGTLGGLVCTVLAAFVLKQIYTIPEGNWFYVFALLMSVSATVGDLLESKIKRLLGVKDSSNLLPGHGGFLDRLDAMLLCSIVAYLFLKFVPLF